jgi:hypothetical protein
MASGAAISAAGSEPGSQVRPPSGVWATGENFRSAEVRKPAVSGPLVGAATTRPPLSATPGGVERLQEALPAGRRNSCHRVLAGSSRCPVARITDDCFVEVTADARGIAGAAPPPGWVVTASWLAPVVSKRPR